MKKYLLMLSLVFGHVIFQSQASNLPACKGSYWTNIWTNCIGTHTYPNGNKYVGEFKDYTINGKGTFTYANGDKYVGEFSYGRRHQGIYTYASGNKYVGGWKDNKKHGRGAFTFANGDRYVGEFKDDNFNGQGTYTFASGEKDVGEWKDGKLNGEAIQYYADGSIKLQGIYKDGEFSLENLYAKKGEPEAQFNIPKNDYSSATWKCGKEKFWEWSQWELDFKNHVLRYQFYYKNKSVDFVEEQVARIVKKHANAVTFQRYDKKENSWVKATEKFNYNQDKISTINQFGEQFFYTGCKRIDSIPFNDGVDDEFVMEF